jgi:hypothetical protein
MAKFSVRQIRQALLGKGNLRTLLSDRIENLDPYKQETLTIFKSIYDEEALKAWERIQKLFKDIPKISALENTWSVISHMPELTGFLSKGVEIEKDKAVIARAKRLSKITSKNDRIDPFQSIQSKKSKITLPDFIELEGFALPVRIRWGLAYKVNSTSNFYALLQTASLVDGISASEINGFLKEALIYGTDTKIEKINLATATKFTDREFEIFTSDPNLISIIYECKKIDSKEEIQNILNVRKKFINDIDLVKKILGSLADRDWNDVGKLGEQIIVDPTSKLAVEECGVTGDLISLIVNRNSFTPWQGMSSDGFLKLKKIFPLNSLPEYLIFNAEQISEKIISSSLSEKEITAHDIFQLNHSWDTNVKQRLINETKYYFLTLEAPIWKSQTLTTIIKAAVSRVEDGEKLLSENFDDIPSAKDLLSLITSINSTRASSLLRKNITSKLIVERRRDKNTTLAKNWDEWIASEIGTKLWIEAVKKSLISRPTIEQLLFANESNYEIKNKKYFENEVIDFLKNVNLISYEIAQRTLHWIDREPSAVSFIAPNLNNGFIEKIIELSENDCSMKAIRTLYEKIDLASKEQLWKMQLNHVTKAHDLLFLCVEGIKYDFVTEWNHRWKRVKGPVEDRAKALTLITRNDPHRFTKIKADFTEKVIIDALIWGANQLPEKFSKEIACMELTAALGTRHTTTIKWLLSQRNWSSPPGSKLSNLYTQHEIPKKSGKLRTISAPNAGLKRIQKSILKQVLNPLGAHDAAYGFVQGRSIVDNAKLHLGRKVVVNIDVKNCFSSVRWPLVLAAVQRDLSKQLSAKTISALTDICTNEGGLPTGAPTSPALLNRILVKTDEILTKQATLRNCTYSRYADDLTFSGDDKAVELIGIATNVLQKISLEIDPEKTNIFRRGRRQMCTGLVVNEKVNIPRAIRKRIRASVHAYESGKKLTWDGHSSGHSALKGRLQFLKMVSPNAAVKLIERFDKASVTPIKKIKKSKIEKA